MNSIKLLFLKSLVILYFALTVIYLLPSNPLKSSLPTSVIFYYSTFFDQNWNLFGNTLATNHLSIDYTCENRTWKIFGDGELNRHKANRLIGAGKMHYALNYISKEIISDIYLKGDLSDDIIKRLIQKNKHYRILEKIIYINCQGFSPPYRFRITINEQERLIQNKLHAKPMNLVLFEDNI